MLPAIFTLIGVLIGGLHLRVSRPTFEKYQRRGLLKPDYLSGAGSFYDFERLPSLADAIERSRSQHSRHLP